MSHVISEDVSKMSSAANAHKHARYKNQGMDVQEMRRIREEEGIQLRKQKREQQLFKRRNVGAENANVQVIKKIFHLH